ncbi:MAG TPA: tetratricopeptide repeat protein, partial [Xanthobacteraceae bacterium]|nr:tetratricopeptide repeat protein [Xanthobacteraceae bacterium]
MNQLAGPGQTALTPLDEALIDAERCRAEGRLVEAEAACRHILDQQPDCPEASHLIGLIAYQNGKLGEAIAHLQRAVARAPEVALFHTNLAEMYRLAGRPGQAVEAARRALAIAPKMPAALNNLGVALYDQKDFEQAAVAQRNAIAADPYFAEAYCNLGNALHGLRRFAPAAAAYRRAVELKPDYADAWANLGTALHHGGGFDEAVRALRRAVALAPRHANAHSGLGILLLMRGNLGEGWDEYEWRLRSSERKGPRFPQTPWRGENLAGKHIYVQAEQGFGDTLQFVRYIPLLAALAGSVTLRAHQQLVTLLRESLPGITVLGDRADPAPYQYDAALLSLPRLFKTRLETIPAAVPYLRASRERTQRWKERFAKLAGIKIGLVWAGNSDHVNDARRSIDLALLAPLFAGRDASFLSLQVGPRAADLDNPKNAKTADGNRHCIDDLAPALADFADSAAAVGALDLVITVDTAMAHLAGALGKPVWVLLPWVTDWRWMLDRDDSSWYPTMRLFRQRRGEDWAAVITRVAQALAALAQGDMTPLTPFRRDGERRAAEAAAIMAAQTADAGYAGLAAVAEREAIPPVHALILAEQKRRHGLLADAD